MEPRKMYDLTVLLKEWHPDWSDEQLAQRVELLETSMRDEKSQFLIPPFVEEIWKKTFEKLPPELHANLDRVRGLLVRDITRLAWESCSHPRVNHMGMFCPDCGYGFPMADESKGSRHTCEDKGYEGYYDRRRAGPCPECAREGVYRALESWATAEDFEKMYKEKWIKDLDEKFPGFRWAKPIRNHTPKEWSDFNKAHARWARQIAHQGFNPLRWVMHELRTLNGWRRHWTLSGRLDMTCTRLRQGDCFWCIFVCVWVRRGPRYWDHAVHHCSCNPGCPWHRRWRRWAFLDPDQSEKRLGKKAEK
jgi:hypothetical protein